MKLLLLLSGMLVLSVTRLGYDEWKLHEQRHLLETQRGMIAVDEYLLDVERVTCPAQRELDEGNSQEPIWTYEQ